MSVVLREGTHVSRGKVRCDDCFTTIPAGVRYHGAAMADDGRAYTWRECTDCADLVLAVTADCLPDESYGPDDFEAWAYDNRDNDPRAVAYLARRTAAYEAGRKQ